MRRVIWHALLIVVASSALGLVVNAVRFDKDSNGNPRRLPWVAPPNAELADADRVSLTEAEQLWNEGAAVFLDARSTADFQAGHITNAHSLPVEEFDAHYNDVAGLISPESMIVAYCDGEQCSLSHELMNRLRQLGYKHVRVLVNGWTTWHTAGLPTATGAETP